jgi:hypothetical protein
MTTRKKAKAATTKKKVKAVVAEPKAKKEIYEQARDRIYEAHLSYIKVKRLLHAVFQFNEDEDGSKASQVFALVVSEIKSAHDAIEKFTEIVSGKIEYEAKRLEAVQVAAMKVEAYLSIMERAGWINHDRAGATILLCDLVARSKRKTDKLLGHLCELCDRDFQHAA